MLSSHELFVEAEDFLDLIIKFFDNSSIISLFLINKNKFEIVGEYIIFCNSPFLSINGIL